MLLPSRLVQQGAPGQEPTFQKTLQFRVTPPPDLPSLERGHLAGHLARDLGVVLAPKPPPLPFQSDSQWSCVKPELMSVQSRGGASPHLQNLMLRAGASEWGQGGVMMVSGHSSHAGLGLAGAAVSSPLPQTSAQAVPAAWLTPLLGVRCVIFSSERPSLICPSFT